MSQQLALFYRFEPGRARQLCPGISDVDFLSNLDRVVDLDAEITDGAPPAERMDAIASTQAVADWQQQYLDTLILMNEYVEAATIEIRTLAANVAMLGGMCNTRSLTFERTVRPGTCTVYMA